MTTQVHGKDVLDAESITSGTLLVARGGTGVAEDTLQFDEIVAVDFTAWSTYLSNSGGATQAAHQLRLYTGGIANSKASCYCETYNAVAGLLPVSYGFFDIDIDMGWVIGMEGDVANSKTYLMYGLNYTAGDPTVEALGFRIDNLSVKGIVHDGSSLHVVDLATTLTNNGIFELSLVFTAGSKLEWFINGVLKGESTNIPSGTKTISIHKISVQTTNGTTADGQAISCYKATYRQKTWG